MKFYIPASSRYVEYTDHDDIVTYNVHEADGSYSSWVPQIGKSHLPDHELLSIGRLVEIYKQIRNGQREYDAFALFPKELIEYHKKNYLSKESNDE